MREHGIAEGGVVVRGGGCKCFGIVSNTTISPCGNKAMVFLSYISLRRMSMSSDSGRYPNKTML
jgi:hypothetical protein